MRTYDCCLENEAVVIEMTLEEALNVYNSLQRVKTIQENDRRNRLLDHRTPMRINGLCWAIQETIFREHPKAYEAFWSEPPTKGVSEPPKELTPFGLRAAYRALRAGKGVHIHFPPDGEHCDISVEKEGKTETVTIPKATFKAVAESLLTVDGGYTQQGGIYIP